MINKLLGVKAVRLPIPGTALALLVLLLFFGLVQACSGDDGASEFTAANLESGEVIGFLHRPVDRPAATFTLTDQNDRTVSLEDLGGKWLVITWLYTSCVDVCPALTFNMKMVQQGLGDRMGEQVQMATITFDWEHDTVEQMKSHSIQVGADIPGWSWLTGTKEQTDAVAEAYGVAFAQIESSESMEDMDDSESMESGGGHSHGGVAFDHTALTVVIDPQGIERHRYFGVGWSQDMLDRLEQDLAKPNTGANGVNGSPVDTAEDGAVALPIKSGDLEELLEKATIFPFEDWELPPGATSQALYQFAGGYLAKDYRDGLLSKSQSQGWETTSDFLSSDSGIHWVVMVNGDAWVALGIAQEAGLVFTVEAESSRAVNNALDVISGDFCCA